MDVPSLRVAPVGPGSAEGLARLHATAFETRWSAADLTQVMASPLVFALQAEATVPLGFIFARVVAGEAEILTLAVDPGARRQGVGRALVTAAVGVAVAAGAEVMWLEVAQDNAAALSLYAATGFEEAGRRRGYYSRPGGLVDALTLRCRLNSAPA